MKNTVKSVDRTSPLYGRAEPGDTLVSLNGNIIHDVLDYKFFAYDAELDVVLQKKSGEEKKLHIRKEEGGDLGLDFETYLMDAPRSCANNCIFCFIDQLPENMRSTMYFKDDDARLSFLLGNYITLTNLSEREVQRIIDLRISPVNVSVHTTDPKLRCEMLRNPNAGRGLDIMRRFADAGIVMNCQIVCCPGINDGRMLDKTMCDLESMYPAVHSVSVVPVGLTKYREKLYPLRGFTRQAAADTVEQVSAFAEECVKKHGSHIFYCSDEMYIKAGICLPEDEYYEEHTQLENGVGMLRLLEAEFVSALSLSDEPDGIPFSVASGESASVYISRLLCTAKAKYNNLNGKVYPIRNDYFGPEINVTGLITGTDIINQLKGKDLGERLLISSSMLRRDEQDFLDGITLAQLSETLGVPVFPVESDGFALLDAFCGLLPELRTPGSGEDTEYYKYNT